ELDPLTHLPRRQGIMQAFAHAQSKIQRYGHPLALALIDIDHFKRVNDTDGYRHLTGHDAGDLLLQDTSELLKATLRSGDSVGRWGGEEFVAILPLVYDNQLSQLQPAQQAMIVAERMRGRMETQTGKTISLGITVYPTTISTPSLSTMIHQADDALYAAKEQGRNRSLLYTPSLLRKAL
ncbi:MAG: GGDEF domain-containing protein, partial [Nanoarchaeota archaeon]